jgi:cellulose synthase (UDP-forming)
MPSQFSPTKGTPAATSRASAPPQTRIRDVPFRGQTPVRPAWLERLSRTIALIALAYALYYLYWRWTATLNFSALWFSIPLAIAESAVVLTTALLIFNIWKLRQRAAPPARAGLSVDVFITTYDEPLDVIRRTAVGARAISYPHRTWLLDDGRRPEVKALARELGVDYITRADNRHAKAGNLNNALQATTGDFILQLDADHVPLPHILDRMLGYFDDEQVAFVQSPQNFYNTDSFSGRANPENRRRLTDQNIFFSVIQAGKDRMNAAFFCGSCAVLRRRAVLDVGGFSKRTITEDIETSLLLHARGWRSVYHAEALAYGLAPRTATAFHIQRLRWAQGGLQMLRQLNPLTLRGQLTLAQRVAYFASALHPLDGLLKLIFYLTPIVFLFTGLIPIAALNGQFFLRFVPFFVLFTAVHMLMARGTAGPYWYVEYGAMARFFTHTLSFAALFSRKRLPFRVTPKGLDGVSWASYAPHLVLLVITLLAMLWSVPAWWFGWGFFAFHNGLLLPITVNFAWAAWNAIIAAVVLRDSIRSHQRRPEYRFEELSPVRFRVLNQGPHAHWQVGLTENLSTRGLAFRSTEVVPVGSRLSFLLHLTTATVGVTGRVVHVRRDQAAGVSFYRHGVQLDEMAALAREAIAVHCAWHIAPLSAQRWLETIEPLDEALLWVRDRRRDERRTVALPLNLVILDRHGQLSEDVGVLEDTSRSGARIIVEQQIDPGSIIRFEVPGGALHGAGTVAHATRLETPLGERCILGIRDVVGMDDFRQTSTRERRMKQVAMIAGLLAFAKRFTVIITAGLLLAGGARPAAAQFMHGWFSSAETDGDGQSLLLLGVWSGLARPGWSPGATFVGHRLAYPSSDGSVVIWTANPALTLRYGGENAGIQASAGYAFQSEGSEPPAGVARRTRPGATTGLMADWRAAGPTSLLGALMVSWGDGGYAWSRARALHRVAGNLSMLRLGADLSWQGDDSFRALEAGPVLEWRSVAGFSVLGGAGYRRTSQDNTASNGAWFRLEAAIVP